MARDDLDVEAMLIACDGQGLDVVIHTLTTGSSHHNLKVEEVSNMMPFVRSMSRVVKLLEATPNKFKKLMSAKLWVLGCAEVGGAFKMETLVTFVRGVRALK